MHTYVKIVYDACTARCDEASNCELVRILHCQKSLMLRRTAVETRQDEGCV